MRKLGPANQGFFSSNQAPTIIDTSSKTVQDEVSDFGDAHSLAAGKQAAVQHRSRLFQRLQQETSSPLIQPWRCKVYPAWPTRALTRSVYRVLPQ